MDAPESLLRWYRTRSRRYPWRRRPSPYRTLVSEVMLQQTQASRVVAAFEAFVARFPTIRALASAPLADVVRAWGSLGHNRRAVALWKAVRIVADERGGRIPDDPEVLRGLPGIGPYTAAAVASIAYGVPVPAVDTNVLRVVARARLGANPRSASPRDVARAAAVWLDRRDPATWNQALMDLGRETCRPDPRCEACPLARSCRFRRSGKAAERKRPRKRAASSERFEGSSRQLPGHIVAALRSRPSTSLRTLARSSGRSLGDVATAVDALGRDGLVELERRTRPDRGGDTVRLAGPSYPTAAIRRNLRRPT